MPRLYWVLGFASRVELTIRRGVKPLPHKLRGKR
jgi:hypothetical protein